MDKLSLSDQETATCEPSTPKFSPKDFESGSFEDVLIHVTSILKHQLDLSTKYIADCSEHKETLVEFIDMMHAAELLHLHFDFTLCVLNSQSEEEVQELKETTYKLVRKHYENVKSCEDLAFAPAKAAVIAFYDKIVSELPELVDKCFKLNYCNDMAFNDSAENLTNIKILTGRLEIADAHYPPAVLFSKNDLFYNSKDSEVWKELKKSAVVKSILTKEEASQSYSNFQFANNMGHVILKTLDEQNGLTGVKSGLVLLKNLISCGTNKAKAESHALLRLTNPDVESAFHVWNIPEEPWVFKMVSLSFPVVGFDERIYIPRLFPQITKEVILKEYKDNTLNKMCPIDKTTMIPVDLSSTKEKVLQDLLVETEEKVAIRIIAPEHINIKNKPSIVHNLFKNAVNVVGRKARPYPKTPEMEKTILIHVHGGGFVSMSSGTHRVYLNRWVQDLEMVIFSVDYRLAPKNKYPDALDDVWQAYHFIVNYAESILGIKNSKIILVGDSAGGNLITALTLRLIRAGLPTPHACFLIYPALWLNPDSSSPSSFASLDDTVLPTSLLKLCAKSYISEEFDNLIDPFISPLAASDELLAQLPPLRVVVGSRDPLCDDSWRLLHRMKALNKDIKLTVHEHIPHAFLCNVKQKNYEAYMVECCETIRELISIE